MVTMSFSCIHKQFHAERILQKILSSSRERPGWEWEGISIWILESAVIRSHKETACPARWAYQLVLPGNTGEMVLVIFSGAFASTCFPVYI